MHILRMFALVLSFLAFGSAHAKIDVPTQLPEVLVVDYANRLTPEQRVTLSQKLRAYYEATSNVFVVVTVPSLSDTGEAGLQEWNLKLFDTWKPGSKEKNNGLIMTISGTSPPYKVRINPGRGLTGALPDLYCKHLIDDKVKPVLNADFVAGINVAIDDMSARIGSEFAPTVPTAQKANDDRAALWILILVGIALVVLTFVASNVHLLLGCVVGAIGGAFFAVLATFPVVYGVVMGIVIAIISWAVTKGGGSGDGDSDGFFAALFSSGGGGGGGFTDTGGDFDGGGAGDD